VTPFIRIGFNGESQIKEKIKSLLSILGDNYSEVRGLTLEDGYKTLNLTSDNQQNYIFVIGVKSEQVAKQIVRSLRDEIPYNEALINWYKDHTGEHIWVQISPPDASKGIGLNRLEFEEFKISTHDSSHLGDEWNDMSAYKNPDNSDNQRLAGIVETAPEEMLSLADFIIPRPSNDGAAHFLETMVKIRAS
jgi:hydroxymethylpyrimidine pyrophosphatase-like HAD family hydrolase